MIKFALEIMNIIIKDARKWSFLIQAKFKIGISSIFVKAAFN